MNEIRFANACPEHKDNLFPVEKRPDGLYEGYCPRCYIKRVIRLSDYFKHDIYRARVGHPIPYPKPGDVGCYPVLIIFPEFGEDHTGEIAVTIVNHKGFVLAGVLEPAARAYDKNWDEPYFREAIEVGLAPWLWWADELKLVWDNGDEQMLDR